jgi:uncharacterized membrane protein
MSPADGAADPGVDLGALGHPVHEVLGIGEQLVEQFGGGIDLDGRNQLVQRFPARRGVAATRRATRPSVAPGTIHRPTRRGRAMGVDVLTEIDIDRPHDEVAAYAADPSNAPEWYANIETVDWKTDPPLRDGSVLAFVARFLGRRLEYSYEIVELVPGERLVMRTAQGPFPMETAYTWAPTPSGGTHMTLRNRGKPSGFSKLVAPFMAPAMRRANRKDLVNLKSILEQG